MGVRVKHTEAGLSKLFKLRDGTHLLLAQRARANGHPIFDTTVPVRPARGSSSVPRASELAATPQAVRRTVLRRCRRRTAPAAPLPTTPRHSQPCRRLAPAFVPCVPTARAAYCYNFRLSLCRFGSGVYARGLQ